MKEMRRTYTREFKEEAVKLFTHQGYSTEVVAGNLGINANMHGRWKRLHSICSHIRLKC